MNLTKICLLVWVCGFLAACNYDTGECWVKGEDGTGTTTGVIVPGAGGGFGDVPPDPQSADPPPGCDDDETELDSVICSEPTWGQQCSTLCRQRAGVACYFAVEHSKTKETALLYRCCGCKGKQQCWYTTPDGHVCVSANGVLLCE